MGFGYINRQKSTVNQRSTQKLIELSRAQEKLSRAQGPASSPEKLRQARKKLSQAQGPA
ncbi:hypothetical protein L195_g064646, partial [Trifolium pratense]